MNKFSPIFEEYNTLTRLSVTVTNSQNMQKKSVRKKGQFLMQRLYYVVNGKVKFVRNGKTVRCEKGDILYLPSDVTYTSVWEENEENSAILIQFDFERDGKRVELNNDLFIVARDEDQELLRQFNSLATVYFEGKYGYKLKCQTVLTQILSQFIPKIEVEKKEKVSDIERGILFIENNYLNKFDIDEVASLCLMCSALFRRKFKKVVGVSPLEYKNKLKMKRAKELLESTDLTVGEIAEEVGIDDIYYFSRLFKKTYGFSPTDFRKSL